MREILPSANSSNISSLSFFEVEPVSKATFNPMGVDHSFRDSKCCCANISVGAIKQV